MQYFKHMSNMRNDVKMRRVIAKYGIEGYGLYNLILESITESLTTESPMPDLQETCEDIAEFYSGNTARINEIANFMINQGLIEVDELTERIICHKIYKFLEQNQTRSKEIRAMINKYKSQNIQIPDNSGASQMSETVGDKSEEEKRTEEKRKEKNITEQKRTEESVLPIDTLISNAIKYWNSRGNLPKCRYMVFNLPKLLDIKPKFDVFAYDEIERAIDNLSSCYEKEDPAFRPSSFENFISRSIDRWIDDVKPWERYEKSAPSLTDEEIAEIWK